ncbi:C40 family peptidase [Pseudonocardia dioxanivorans]|uniref:C40 family peptidase n=1 Tax=Pseudonocardia dioxanivorans TaxID=240495 RepID=UPI002D7782C9|nr:NlpC/P60 family protein [Pseudonocardia dioxanivorans]
MPTHTARFLTIRTAVVAVTAAAAAFAVVPAGTTPAASGAAVLDSPAVATAEAPAVVTRPAQVVSTPVENVASKASVLSIVMSKIGAPYRYGAAGPSAFDCSGLMYWAFKQVGITLPRTSRAQSTFGTPVAKSALQPGDLVFFYKPVSHVAMYIGNGQVVHASTAGQPVKISSLASMPFSGARRV